ncbi:PalH/RIM21-domain-containing protein [Astrocystis sublimbata]|nr:PalH/RIM21-domain-containing protein [Astrocystis sublimbata]
MSACAPLTLAAGGVYSIAGAAPTILAAGAVLFPPCATLAPIAQRAIIVTGGVSTDEAEPISPDYDDFRTPFYATVFPQCYALAATTVLAYMLLIMLVIAPRSFLDGGIVTLGRRGFANGRANGITIGGRPTLQKIAALSVAVSLTIASVDTFRVAEEQYVQGFQDAHKLQEQVLGGTQLKVIQLISDTFLWLAQAQTLIRLFPRQREKIIIKWTAFALISLDLVFGALNSFQYMTHSFKPRQFTEAVPALSYLFQLSLGLLYAAWVLYYALMKKRYAFYHPLMKNISLMAAFSIGSLLVPVVFFVLDIAEPKFTGWGDYVRWVGAAAASVVVWEWVERIEALEREEKKDGVLGREVFDGDEMIDISPSDLTWPRRRKSPKTNESTDGGDGNRYKGWPATSSISRRYRLPVENNSNHTQDGTARQVAPGRETATRFLQPPLWVSRPPPAVTPISRTDTASADSTIYRVRYQPLTETTSRTTDDGHRPPSREDLVPPADSDPPLQTHDSSDSNDLIKEQSKPISNAADGAHPGSRGLLGSLAPWNPFRRRSRDPPAEVLPHTMPKTDTPQRDHDTLSRWDIRGRVEDFAATQAERVLQRIRPTPDTESLPVTVIPAPARRGAAMARLLEEGERERGTATSPDSASREIRNYRPPSLHQPDHGSHNPSPHVSLGRRYSGSSTNALDRDC